MRSRRLAVLLLLSIVLGCFWLFGNRLSTVSAQSAFAACQAAVACNGLAGGASASNAAGRGRRRRRDRGLPKDDALRDLTRTYLENQRRLWPDLAAAGLIPEPTDAVLDSYAERFRKAFLGEEVDAGPWNHVPAGGTRSAVYLRFSSENSNPRSLDQQLRLTLERACREQHFVPWEHVYADSGVSGTTAGRTGYQLAKAAMSEGGGPKALYVDDLSRLSRDMVESVSFCRDLSDAGRRVVGASDGFDTEQEQYKALLAVSGVLHEFYVDGLKKKVGRGQDDAFRQGKNLRPPGFGYRLVPVTDAQGRPIVGRKQRQQMRVVIDAPEAAIVRDVFDRYVVKGQSTNQIATWLNEIAAGGRRTWGVSNVADMLDRYTYVGIEVQNKMRQRKDRKTGKITEEKRPRKDWKARRTSRLQIIDWKTWKAVRERRAERSKLFPKGSRGRVAEYPTRLVRLVCGSCGAVLVLGKSGKYAQVRCPNALEGKQGCKFSGYKSVAKVEGPILKLVAERLADPAYVNWLVEETNAVIAKLAKKPKADLAPLEQRIRELRVKERRLKDAIENSEVAQELLTPRLEENHRRLVEAQSLLANARAASAPPPEPVTADHVRTMLSDISRLLAEEASVAARALRQILGDVVVTQVAEEGREKPTWFAEFRINGLRAAGQLGENGTRDAKGLSRVFGAVDAPLERIRLDPLPKPPKATKVPPYKRLADEAVRLRDEGLSFKEIAQQLGVHEVTAMRACDYGRPEQRPQKGKKRAQGGKAAQIRRHVAELLTAGRSNAEAAREAGCSEMTARRVAKGMLPPAEGNSAEAA